MPTIPPPSDARKMLYRHMADDHMRCARTYRAHGWLALADEEARLSVRYSDLAFREELRIREEQERGAWSHPPKRTSGWQRK